MGKSKKKEEMTKEERKEHKRLKKLKKEAKKAKKRKLEEMENGTTEEVETPPAKKMKMSDDEKEEQPIAEINYEEIAKAVIKASKEQLQSTLIKCAKSTPSTIPEIESILGGTEIDQSLKTALEDAIRGPPKMPGVILKWNHSKGFGFIQREDGKGDVFCHSSNITVDTSKGHSSPKVGSKVEFHIEEDKDKGDRAANVTAIGGGACESGMEMEGTVSRWTSNDHGTFGFIQGDDGIDYFAGDRDLWIASGVLTPGQRVQFDIKRKEDGKTQATYINEIGGIYDEYALEQAQQALWAETETGTGEGEGAETAEQTGYAQY